MSVNAAGAVTTAGEVYASYGTAKADTSSKKTQEEKKNTAADEKTATEGVVYEKSEAPKDEGGAYKVNKMSKEERAALVKQLQADQQSRQEQLAGIVQKMLGEQANSFANATDLWKFLAKGDFTVDEQTKLQAQRDIAEDGYYGVEQTSQRLFDFASALAGDDVEQMKKMQEAMEKGFSLATKDWGRELPDISKKTLEAANQKFEEYYASKEKSETEVQ